MYAPVMIGGLRSAFSQFSEALVGSGIETIVCDEGTLSCASGAEICFQINPRVARALCDVEAEHAGGERGPLVFLP